MRLTDEQVNTFEQQGVVIAPGVMTDADLQPVIDEIDVWLTRRATALKDEGKLNDLFEGEPFDRRYALLYEQCKEIGQGIDIMQRREPAMFQFLFNDNLLDAVECLIGPEITCNPIQHLRAKPPAALTGEGKDYFHNVPWHQDAGVTWEEADDTPIITCWLPLVDATRANGCMQIMPGAHTAGQLDHQREGGTTIVPDQLPHVRAQTAECPKGGVVFMNKFMPHKSLPNRTDQVRWSLDLRYQPTGMPTGRPFHPEFAVRSRANPASIDTTYEQWCERWVEALEKSKGIEAHRVKK